MECSHGVACRAKEIAEMKFKAKDIDGAKRFALKAQDIFPGLDGISQMIATLDVYLCAEVVTNGEKDWYSILGVDTSADEEIIRKQYKTAALLLHPDKNKAIGAEGAFKLISEAWSVLSDRGRRMAYDQKRNVKRNQVRAPQTKANYAFKSTGNGFYHFAKSAASGVRTQNTKGAASRSAPQSSVSHPYTFWTSCNRCKMQYEYLGVYLNHNLLCPSCHEPFLATEIPVPSNRPCPSVPWATSSHTDFSHSHPSTNTFSSHKSTPVPGIRPTGCQQGSTFDTHNNPNFQWGAFSRTAGAASAVASFSAAAQTVNMVHQTYEKVRRERKEAEAAAKKAEVFQKKKNLSKSFGVQFSGNSTSNVTKRSFSSVTKADRPFKRSNIGDDGETIHAGDEAKNAAFFEAESSSCFPTDSGKVKLATRQSSVLRRESSQLNIRSALVHKAKVLIQKKLDEFNSETVLEKEKTKQKQRPNMNGKDKEKAEDYAYDGNNMEESRNIQDLDKAVVNDEKQEVISMSVPDPDFHDFDMDRSEKSFEADQVWATYDDEDGMPRLYVMVKKLLSLKPFKVRLSFLNSRNTSEFGQLDWVGLGFAKTCGDFRIGRYETRNTLNIFSHRVNWERCLRGVIRIVPRKGDIWAIYKNWSLDWNENTSDDIIHKYDVVEVLEYTEEGVDVIPLVKVVGFMTVFHQHNDLDKYTRIPREEMFRFSHQVPYYILTGKEAYNAPKGYYELDPAATPSELLHVISVADEEMEVSELPSG